MERKLVDNGDGTLTDLVLADSADLRAVAEDCRAMREAGAAGNGDVKHLMQVPAALVEKYINDCGITFREFMTNPEHATRMVNDPALAAFRVWQGRWK